MLNPYITYANGYIQLAQEDTIIDGMDVYAYKAMDGVLMYGVEARAHYHPHFAHRLHFETGYSNTFGRELGVVQSGGRPVFYATSKIAI